MGFLAKVEAAVFKAKRLNKAKEKDMVKPRAAKAKKPEVSFSNLSNTRKLIPMITESLVPTDPFDFKNETWITFLQQVTPKLMAALLLDMGIVPKEKKNDFIRYLGQRLRHLIK